MKCPHCAVAFSAKSSVSIVTHDADGRWTVSCTTCPECNRATIALGLQEPIQGINPHQFGKVTRSYIVNPKSATRPVPLEVPNEFADDYKEAALVLGDSAKASAALSRRVLQHLLREKAGIAKKDLADQIQEVLNSRQLPSHLADGLDAVRHIGNFAAHSIKSTSTGEIVDVEPGEAEWTLDVLDGLFDFYFVQPAQLKAKRDALNQKLADAGKPQLR